MFIDLSTDTDTVFLHSRKAGFTLLEIMISLGIIGVLLITLIYTLNYHLGIVERHETITTASLLAREKIEEKYSGEKKGTFPEPYSSYSYEIGLSESAYPGVSEISVVVRRDKEEIRFAKLIESPK
ncbi:MAG: type II secretion system protein [Nitrospirae bacterium]|nr:type II secretion system protein [Nitrospirota bacterium]